MFTLFYRLMISLGDFVEQKIIAKIPKKNKLKIESFHIDKDAQCLCI